MNALVRDRPITIAILAIGGQGGGVLSDWLIDLAERNGWYVQETSVPGVAQRTGATIYYLEMIPFAGKMPVLAMMPAPGDVDIVIAAELMEAGRAVQRGLVSPDRTTVIASSHRALGILEKTAPGDGVGNAGAVEAIVRRKAKRTIVHDLQRLAEANNSVISASLFGALAASGALPFPRATFEETIRSGGRGAEASLAAFAAGAEAVALGDRPAVEPEPRPRREPRIAGGSAWQRREFDRAVQRIADELPAEIRAIATAGLRHVADFQDAAYGHLYLDRLAGMLTLDRANGGAAKGFALTMETAKYLANAMAYDDVIRVADLKTRPSRFARISGEIGITGDQVVHLTEFMHPRAEEICGTMPAGLGRWIERRPRLVRAIDRAFNKGRHVRTDSVRWFLVLYGLAGLKRFRRRLLRHAVEEAHIATWLATAARLTPLNYDLAVEVIRCRRLIKGYSDTRSRGEAKFDRVLSALPLLEARADGADWLRRLREAALLDEKGVQLDGALKTVATL
ncbi:MAG TPA: indolepyruvate oxidoreductase subunit beta family protein [Bauldia sp.]|nr:indolepyruvate oxidoreductase subunit beta family protein [Bauldia sp.]